MNIKIVRLRQGLILVLYCFILCFLLCAYEGSTGFQLLAFVCSSVSVLVLLLSTHPSRFISVMNLDFAVFIHWRVRSPSCEPNNLHVYEPQQSPGRRLRARKTGLRSLVIYYWPFQGGASVLVNSNCQCSSAFCWSLIYCSFYLG